MGRRFTWRRSRFFRLIAADGWRRDFWWRMQEAGPSTTRCYWLANLNPPVAMTALVLFSRNLQSQFSIPVLFLFLCGDTQGLHFSIEMAALEAEGFGGAAYVAVVFVQFF